MKASANNLFYGINLEKGKFGPDVALGFLLGIVFIYISVLSPAIAFGLPNFGLSLGDFPRFIVVGILAPLIEEILFRGAILGLLRIWGVNVYLAIVIQAILFSLYHLVAYGGSIADASGAFLGAALFGTIAGLITYYRMTLTDSIIMHSLFNTFQLSKLSVVVT